MPARRWRIALAAASATALTAGEGLAQAVDENALKGADDAFGTSIGRESIGLYSSSSVRGFSPYAAGNIRIEGLYIDALALPNNRLASGSSVRVGISAQGYPFPAPTGIADYRIDLPGEELRLRASWGINSYGSSNGELSLDLPLVEDKLSLGLAANIADDKKLYWGGEAGHATAAAVLHWRPVPNVEVIPFASYFSHYDENTYPRISVAGDFMPPRMKRGTYYGQSWTVWTEEDVNYGVIGRATAGDWRVAAGLFRSTRERDIAYSDQFQGTAADGLAANHRVIVSPGNTLGSTSGEVRISRQFAEGPRRHTLHLSVRGRDQRREYGGGTAVDFGPDRIQCRTTLARPTVAWGPRSTDKISQVSGGLAYEGLWSGVGELSLGLQKTDYKKDIEAPGGAAPSTRAKPWLYNAGLAAQVNDRLVAYAGYTRGLEESAAAPETAINRDQAPPAILTRQYDAGLRWDVTPRLKLIGGVFNIEKPYFSVDSTRVYRDLGQVRQRGAELSLVGKLTSDLNILAGALLMDAAVEGEAASAGLVGGKPVGSTDRIVTLNLEYAPPQIRGLSLDLGVTSTGPRVANTANTFSVPGVETVGVGFRYSWKLAQRPTTLRVQVTNLFNTYDWDIVSSNTFAYQRPREISARLTSVF